MKRSRALDLESGSIRHLPAGDTEGGAALATPDIRTERLRLGPLRTGDAPAIFEYRSDPEVARYQSWASSSLAEATEFVAAMQSVEFDTPGTWYQLAIRPEGSDALLGDLGVRFLPPDARQVELGVTLAPRHQGRGYATEALSGLLDHLFGALGKHRVFASVDPGNAPCRALLERVGMRQEAHFRRSLFIRGEWVDDVVYAVLGSEWANRSGAAGASRGKGKRR